MKKKIFCGKRLLTLLLSVSLVMSEAAVVTAAPVAETEEVTETVTDETASEAAESISENNVDETEHVSTQEVDEIGETETDEDEESEEPADSEEDAETEEEENEIAEEGAYNGTPSKVIGLDSRFDSDVTPYFDEKGNVIAEFNTVYPEGYTVTYTNTDVQRDAATGYYLYQGKYYNNKSVFSNGTTKLFDRVHVFTTLPTAADDGFYHVDGKLYLYLNSNVVAGKTVYYISEKSDYAILATLAASVNMDNAIKSYGVDTDKDGDYEYYKVNGRYFKDINYRAQKNGNINVYAVRTKEISPTLLSPVLSWKSLSTSNVVSTGNKEILVGYQVEENGKLVTEYTYNYSWNDYALMLSGGELITTASNYYSSKSMSKASYRVRGVYYTREVVEKTVNGEKVASDVYKLLSYGDWSETYSLNFSRKQIPAITSLSVKQETADKLYYTWNQVEGAVKYELRIVSSDKPITGLTKDNFFYASSLAKDGQQISTASYTMNGQNANYKTYSYDVTHPYVYAIVFVSEMWDAAHYYNMGNAKYGNIAAITATLTANLPVIQDFTVTTKTDGNIVLNWKPVDAKVSYYIIRGSAFPQYYDYVSAYIVEKNANGNYTYASDDFVKAVEKTRGTAWSRTIASKIMTATMNGSTGELELSASSFDENEEIWILMKAYDDTIKEPVAYAKIGDKQYYAKTAMGAATAPVKVRVQKSLSRTTVYTVTTKNSVRLCFATSYTGYQVYKKNGKKYKLLGATTDNHYIDKNLKNGKTYEYKVRGYKVDPVTRKVSYSKYTYVKATTGTNKKIAVSVIRKSKTAATVRWTKVPGVKKYEIYRVAGTTGDSREYTYSNSLKTMIGTFRSTNYELIKTITKASATSYTDKSLKPDQTYTYKVVATYKNGKKTALVEGSASTTMSLGVPLDVQVKMSGTSAKVTWVKDPYAQKYEVKYTITKETGELVSATASYASVKTNAYTIQGIPANGSVAVSVRSINGKTVSTWSTERKATNGLAVPTGVKAVNVKVTTSSGKTVNAIKITWKPVSGAKYYKVYRRTTLPSYDTVSKHYWCGGDQIDCESNDNEGSSNRKYEMYNKIEGSIVGTSAIDYGQLESGVKYYYQVSAFTANGVCSSFDVYSDYNRDYTTATGASAPSIVVYEASSVQLKSVKNSKKGKVTVTASSVTGASKYEFYRSTNKKKGYKLIGSSKKPTFTDKKAKKGKTYYYKVVAKGKNALLADFETKMSSSKKIKVKK